MVRGQVSICYFYNVFEFCFYINKREFLFMFQYFRFIEIGIKQCRSSGIDCKVYGLIIFGRLRFDEDDVVVNFSFFVLDREEEEEEKVNSLFVKKKKKVIIKEIQINVFCWGLNDKDQLGGFKGLKVSFVFIYKNCLEIILILGICSVE